MLNFDLCAYVWGQKTMKKAFLKPEIDTYDWIQRWEKCTLSILLKFIGCDSSHNFYQHHFYHFGVKGWTIRG